MSISSSTSADAPPARREALSVLASARAARQRADAAEAELLVDTVEWAVTNPPVFARNAAVMTVQEREGRRPVTEALCADGVPQVDRAAVAELGLALGTSTQAAQALIADALELAYRLPTLWTRTIAGEVKPWRARQVAQATRPLGRLAAGFVDRQLAPVAHRAGSRLLEQLVHAAITRFQPELAEQSAAARAEGRFVAIDLDQTSIAGLTPLAAVIELPDALDLNTALAHGAAQLTAWGSAENLDARRARALGDLARQHLAWNGQPCQSDRASEPDPEIGRQPSRRVPPKRQIVLYLHLTDATMLTMLGRCTDTSFAGELDKRVGSGEKRVGGGLLGRVENTATAVTADTIRDWCSDPGTRVSVRPVIDLDDHLHADSYEIPARLAEQIRLRDHTCVFPGCHARGLSCQDDHTIPYNHDHPETGGQTQTSNLALLCQRHHNLKTHHGFSYTQLATGAILWRTPHGLRIRRETDATTTVTGLPQPPGLPDLSAPPPDDPPEP